MSTEQSVDPELVEQTKQQIRNLVREIAQLSKSELTPLEYYDAILNRVVTALAAVGGAIWSVADGRIELLYQINLRESRLGESQEAQNRHGRLLSRFIEVREGAPVSVAERASLLPDLDATITALVEARAKLMGGRS